MPTGVYERKPGHGLKMRNQFNFVPGVRQKAKEEGLTTYEGSPCKNCGSILKYSCNSGCVDCLSGKENRAKMSVVSARYRVRRTNQMPPDADNKLIKVFYEEAQRLTEETGIIHNVDHIKPVSKGGLHHQDNLQVITKTENLKKGSKYEDSTNHGQSFWSKK